MGGFFCSRAAWSQGVEGSGVFVCPRGRSLSALTERFNAGSCVAKKGIGFGILLTPAIELFIRLE